jgi:serine/threonine protein kinase
MYEMATGRVPFKAADMKGLYKKVIRADYPPLPSKLSKDLREIIMWMLKVEPAARPDCELILNSKKIVEQIKVLQSQDPSVALSVDSFLKMSETGSLVQHSPDRYELLKSIRMTKVYKKLVLPAANYETRSARL